MTCAEWHRRTGGGAAIGAARLVHRTVADCLPPADPLAWEKTWHPDDVLTTQLSLSCDSVPSSCSAAGQAHKRVADPPSAAPRARWPPQAARLAAHLQNQDGPAPLLHQGVAGVLVEGDAVCDASNSSGSLAEAKRGVGAFQRRSGTAREEPQAEFGCVVTTSSSTSHKHTESALPPSQSNGSTVCCSTTTSHLGAVLASHCGSAAGQRANGSPSRDPLAQAARQATPHREACAADGARCCRPPQAAVRAPAAPAGHG